MPVCNGLYRDFVRAAGHLIQGNSFAGNFGFGTVDWHVESLFLRPARIRSLKRGRNRRAVPERRRQHTFRCFSQGPKVMDSFPNLPHPCFPSRFETQRRGKKCCSTGALDTAQRRSTQTTKIHIAVPGEGIRCEMKNTVQGSALYPIHVFWWFSELSNILQDANGLSIVQVG